jgi:hypothetical protein
MIREAIDDGSGAFVMPAASCAADSVFEIASVERNSSMRARLMNESSSTLAHRVSPEESNH